MTSTEKETNSSLDFQIREQADQLDRNKDSVWADHRQQTNISEIGEYNLILEGLREFQVIIKVRNKFNGKMP